MRIDYKHLIKGGNIKLGNMGSISKLAGNCEYTIEDGNGQETITGSCGRFCSKCGTRSGCYVFKSYRYPSVIKGHARTTAAFRVDINKAFEAMDGQLSRKRKPFEVIRINQSGEIESVLEFAYYKWLAEKHPETVFFFYTKAFEYVEDHIINFDLPKNMVVLCSIWHEYGIEEYKRMSHIQNVKAFIYDDGYDYSRHGLKIESYCPAYDHKGHLNHNATCDKCKKCFDGRFKILGTFPH